MSREFIDLAKEGAFNLARNCAEARSGDKVTLVNERGRVEEDAVDLIVEAVKSQGARCDVLWVERGPDGLRLSKSEMDTVLNADKVIASTGDMAPFADLIHAEQIGLVVKNHLYNYQLLGTELGRYHWGMASAIVTRLEELFAQGKRWRVTTASGTDISGKIGDLSVRARYVDEERPPAMRSTSTLRYRSVASTDAEGRVVVPFASGLSRIPSDEPAVLVVENNQVTAVEGSRGESRETEELRRGVDDLVARFGEPGRVVDSFHGGGHPTAEFRSGSVGNACSRVMHFHIGRTTGRGGDYLNPEIADHTFELDGQVIYRDGKLAFLQDDPVIQAAAERFDVSV